MGDSCTISTRTSVYDLNLIIDVLVFDLYWYLGLAV